MFSDRAANARQEEVGAGIIAFLDGRSAHGSEGEPAPGQVGFRDRCMPVFDIDSGVGYRQVQVVRTSIDTAQDHGGQ